MVWERRKYIVTKHEHKRGSFDHSDDRVVGIYETTAVSDRQAIRNVAYRTGDMYDRNTYDIGDDTAIEYTYKASLA